MTLLNFFEELLFGENAPIKPEQYVIKPTNSTTTRSFEFFINNSGALRMHLFPSKTAIKPETFFMENKVNFVYLLQLLLHFVNKKEQIVKPKRDDVSIEEFENFEKAIEKLQTLTKNDLVTRLSVNSFEDIKIDPLLVEKAMIIFKGIFSGYKDPFDVTIKKGDFNDDFYTVKGLTKGITFHIDFKSKNDKEKGPTTMAAAERERSRVNTNRVPGKQINKEVFKPSREVIGLHDKNRLYGTRPKGNN